MPDSKLGQDLLSSVTGNIPKAMLFVRKYVEGKTFSKSITDMVEGDESVISQEELDMALGYDISMMRMFYPERLQEDLLKIGNNMLAKNADAALSSAQSALGGNADFETMKAKAAQYGFVGMRVQYNPSSLYLTTMAGEVIKRNSDISNIMNNQMATYHMDEITTLSMQLVFDDMNIADAFMLDSAPLSTGGALSMGKSIYSNIKGEGYSVRTQVEGLIACLLSGYTRRVIFCWSDIIFPGMLTSVTANYTMFNKKGSPIRATVDVQIEQKKQQADSEKGGYWNKAFTKAFGQPGDNAILGAASKWDKAKNNALLNFSI